MKDPIKNPIDLIGPIERIIKKLNEDNGWRKISDADILKLNIPVIHQKIVNGMRLQDINFVNDVEHRRKIINEIESTFKGHPNKNMYEALKSYLRDFRNFDMIIGVEKK